MILKASQRGGDAALAVHLLNADDNEQVEIHAINGFMSNDVAGAFQEIRAAASATNCKQYMLSLSLSPPEEASVSDDDFEQAIRQSMKRLGLSGQPHVIIFHEKHARRHAHLVVSRIDAKSMKAINLSFFKDKLCALSRELFLNHGWQVPQGHVDRKLSDPLNYSLEEYQVAKRAKRDPQEVKATLKDSWAQSDSKASFEAALNEAGFQLCRGDRRGFVAIDSDRKVYSLSRWLNIKSTDLKARLGAPEHLQSIEDGLISFQTSDAKNGLIDSFKTEAKVPDPMVFLLDKQIIELEIQKNELIRTHRKARALLNEKQESQRLNEMKRFKQSNSSLRRLWQWAVGRRAELLKTRQLELQEQEKRFETELLSLGENQRLELRNLRAQISEAKRQRDQIEALPNQKPDLSDFKRQSDPDFLFHKSQIKKSPDYVLQLISDKQAMFTRNDIVRKLSHYVTDPTVLQTSIDQVLKSSELISLKESEKLANKFTTRSYQTQHTQMMNTASFLSENKAYGVDQKYLKSAIDSQNKMLQKSVGANLSQEQCLGIEHVLNRRQLACVIGLAGAGKSTMLSAARDAWEQQGYRVLGGALAGKAADGLQQASSIPSRTLHSWEHGWKLGRNELQAGDVFVIDEAGMVGTSQLARIVKHVKEQKAKLVLIGDPQQLQPIDSGTPFKDITEQSGFAELSEIHRQKSDWHKAASIQLARGNTKMALQTYKTHGMIEQAQFEHDAIAALVEDYMVDYELYGGTKSRIALAHSRKNVFIINQGIRAARQSSGELSDSTIIKTDQGMREFAVGDRILFTRNDYSLNVKNGMLGIVQEIDDKHMSIKLDQAEHDLESKTITINTDSYAAIDHGYATTIHKCQGATVDHTFVLKSKTMDKHLNYVAMTRHKEQMRIYTQEKVPTKETPNSQYHIEQDYELGL